MNIAQLLEHLTKIFRVNEQDFQILSLLKKIKSIQNDPSHKIVDEELELRNRLETIRKALDDYNKKNTYPTLQFLIDNSYHILLNDGLETQEKMKKLNDLLLKTESLISSASKIPHRINEILTDHSLNIEQKRNSLEAFLITNIQQQIDITRQNLFKLALKITLYDRNYYLDELGIVEKKIYEIPLAKQNNPDYFFSSTPTKSPQVWHYINSIRSEISACFDKPISFCIKLATLSEVINSLINRYTTLETDPGTNQEELMFFEKTKEFILTHLKLCASIVKNHLVQKREQQWSVWASACLESISYITQINSSEYTKYIGGRLELRNALRAQELKLHTTRAQYFISQSKFLNEPVGYYAEHVLLTPRRDLNVFLEKFNDYTNTVFNIDNFVKAQGMLLNHRIKHGELYIALEIGTALEAQGHSLGTFIRFAIYTLKHPLSDILLQEYLQNLQTIPIPAQCRTYVADIWLCLADFLHERYTQSQESFYQKSAFLCLDQITDRYPPSSSLKAKLKIAQFSDNKKQIEHYEREVSQLAEKEAISATQFTNNAAHSPLQDQLLLCKYYAKAIPISTNFFTDLLAHENPYCVTETIALLESDLPEKKPAIEAVTKLFGNKRVNPLILCEEILKIPTYNSYLIVLKRLMLSSLENDYSPMVKLWKESDYTTDNMRFKILNDIRDKIRIFMFTNSDGIIPGGCNILTDLDIEIHEITVRIIAAHHRDKKSNSFACARGREGLLEAIYALLLLEDRNYYGAQQMAQLSILKAPSINDTLTSPKKLPQESAEYSDNTHTKKSGQHPRRALFAKQSDQSGSTPQLGSQSSKRSPFTLHSVKFSNSESKLSIASSRTPKQTHSSIAPLSLSPRSETPSDQQPDSMQPTCLGHLIKALVIWDTRLKENKDRLLQDIQTFSESLKSARQATHPQELSFILGTIWLNYFDSHLDHKSERDNLWLTPEEITLLKNPDKILPQERKAYIERTQLNLQDHCILEICKDHFEKACRNNGNSTMFPPAILAIFQHLHTYNDEFSCGNHEIAEKRHRNMAKLLKEAVFTHGYLPALPCYAENIPYAEEPSNEEIKLLSTRETELDRLKRVQEAYILAEKCTYIKIERKKAIESGIQDVQQRETGLMKDICTYPLETPKQFDDRFQNMKFEMKFRHSTITCEFRWKNNGSSLDCMTITSSSGKEKNISADCELLKEQFERALVIYCYCKKVSLPRDYPIVESVKNQIIIRHLDIAFIGLIRIIEANDTFLKWRENQIEPLALFLQEASQLPITVWQWDQTHSRLLEVSSTYKKQETLLL